MGLKIRFGGIALLIFLALFFDPMDGVFKWDVISGVCEEVYNYEGNASDDSFTPIDDVQGAFSCGDGSISITVPKIAILYLHPSTSKIEEESTHIQPAPCFGRSLAG